MSMQDKKNILEKKIRDAILEFESDGGRFFVDSINIESCNVLGGDKDRPKIKVVRRMMNVEVAIGAITDETL